jgi:hypothetical protein
VPARRKISGTAGVAALAIVAAAVLSVSAASSARASTYAPPAGQVYLGVQDTAISADFTDFAGLIGKPDLPVVQAFHTWGTDPKQALDRWRGYRARGVLSISTSAGWGYSGLITPSEIAAGEGDAYLLTLNSRIAASGQITYMRPLGEPNNWHNAYSALNSNGTSRGATHSQQAYRQAWRRMYLIVKGGAPRTVIDAKLAKLGMPPIEAGGKTAVPAVLPAPPVSFIWCPIVYGSPNVPGNRPGRYYPGPAWTDWVGTDTYSKYPAFKWLSKHYKKFKGKPFAIGEWGVQDREDPRFVKKLFRWQKSHKRVKMMLYHASFAGREGPMSLFRWPQSAGVTRNQVRSASAYPAYAPEWTP